MHSNKKQDTVNAAWWATARREEDEWMYELEAPTSTSTPKLTSSSSSSSSTSSSSSSSTSSSPTPSLSTPTSPRRKKKKGNQQGHQHVTPESAPQPPTPTPSSSSSSSSSSYLTPSSTCFPREFTRVYGARIHIVRMPTEEVHEILHFRKHVLTHLKDRLPTVITGMIYSYQPFSTYFGAMHEWRCFEVERFIFWPKGRRQPRRICSDDRRRIQHLPVAPAPTAIRLLRKELDVLLHCVS